MILSRQEKTISQIANLAVYKQQENRERRLAFQRWKRDTFRGHDVLAWSFAAGTLWTLLRGRKKQSEDSKLRRTLLGAANLALLAWRARAKKELTPGRTSGV